MNTKVYGDLRAFILIYADYVVSYKCILQINDD